MKRNFDDLALSTLRRYLRDTVRTAGAESFAARQLRRLIERKQAAGEGRRPRTSGPRTRKDGDAGSV